MSSFRGAKNAGWFGSNLSQPIKIDLNFVVDHTNANGLGIKSLKSNGWVRNVFMNTSQTPGSNNGATNPNPLAGYALVQLKQNFNIYLGGFSGFVSPASGSSVKIDNSAMTAGQAYIITTLGNATLAKWQAIGVPPGVTPAVGVSFIALSNGGAGNTLTSRVQVPAVSGITGVEVVGNPNLSISNSSIATNGGAFVLVQFLGPTLTMASYTPAGSSAAGSVAVTSGTAGNAVTLNAGTTLEATGGGSIAVTSGAFTGTPAVLTGSVSYGPVAPVDGSVVGMSIFMDQSSADPVMQNGDPVSG